MITGKVVLSTSSRWSEVFGNDGFYEISTALIYIHVAKPLVLPVKLHEERTSQENPTKESTREGNNAISLKGIPSAVTSATFETPNFSHSKPYVRIPVETASWNV